jgi:hypothetical protein
MAARYYLADEAAQYLQKKNITGLAQNSFDVGKKIVKGLKGELKPNKKYLTMSDDKFLLLAGTTAELKDFRAELNTDKVEAIGLDAAKGDPDPLVTWCTRVDVNHPEKPLESKTTVTLVLVGRPGLFTKIKVDPAPKDPWKPFPHTKDNVTGTGGFLHLDTSFNAALDVAKKYPKAK